MLVLVSEKSTAEGDCRRWDGCFPHIFEVVQVRDLAVQGSDLRALRLRGLENRSVRLFPGHELNLELCDAVLEIRVPLHGR